MLIDKSRGNFLKEILAPGSPGSLYEPHKEQKSNYKGLYGIFYKISTEVVEWKFAIEMAYLIPYVCCLLLVWLFYGFNVI